LIKVVCSRCGFVIYRGDKLVEVEEAVKKGTWGLRCKRCSRKLDWADFEIVVKPLKRSFRY